MSITCRFWAQSGNDEKKLVFVQCLAQMCRSEYVPRISFPTFRISCSLLMALSIMPSALAASPETDDLEFVRSALKDPNVREVVIPAGHYTVNQPLIIDRSDVSLVGEGRVVITLGNNANTPLLILGSIETPAPPVRNLKINNLILQGNRDNQSMECWGGPCDTGGVTNIRNNGITIRGVHQSEITNVQTLSMRSGGIVTEKHCSELHIKNWVSKDNYFDGFAGYETTRSLIEDSQLSENMGAGISLDIQFNGNTFRNIQMRRNRDVNIFMRDSHENLFHTLKLMDSGNHAAFLSDVNGQEGTTPTNNTFENLEVDGVKGNGFHLNSPGTGNKIIGARFRNVRGLEIFEAVPGLLEVSQLRDCLVPALRNELTLPTGKKN